MLPPELWIAYELVLGPAAIAVTMRQDRTITVEISVDNDVDDVALSVDLNAEHAGELGRVLLECWELGR